MSLFGICQKLFSGIVRLLTRTHGHGVENIPKEGAVILCSNHISNVDVFYIGATCRRPVRFMAKKELFKVPVLRHIMRAFGSFPIDRGGADVDALREFKSLTDRGEVVGVFPQGTRCAGKDPRNTKPKPGIGLMAYRTKAPVVPVLIKTGGWKKKLFRRLDIYYGKPITFEELGFVSGGREEYKNAANTLFEKVLELG